MNGYSPNGRGRSGACGAPRRRDGSGGGRGNYGTDRQPGMGGILDWFSSEPEPTALAYDRDAVIAKQNALHGVLPPFAVLDFVSDVPEAQARSFQREAWALADRLRGSGALDAGFSGYVTWFANHGALMYPSRDRVTDDPEALDALNACLVKFGWADLKHRILAARRLTLKDQAEELEKRTAFWDTAYTTLSYVSGEAAVQKCMEYVRKIGESVQATRAELDRIRDVAEPDEYAEALAMTGPINDELSRMNRYVSGGEEATGGALGAPVLVLAVVAGVVLVLLAAIYATVEHHRAAVVAYGNRLLQRRQTELLESRDMEKQYIVDNPELTEAEKSAALARVEESYRAGVSKLPAPGVPGSGGLGGFGGIALLAAAGLAAVLVVPRLLGGGK